MSSRVTPRHFLGSDRSPTFGTSTIWPSCHSSKSVSSSQYLLNIYRSWVRFSLLRSLKAFNGKFFSPGKLSFFNFVTAALSSSHEIGWSISFMNSLCLNSSSEDHSIGGSVQMNLPKCGPTAKAYSTSVVAVIPSCSHILMVVGFLWWLVSPPHSVIKLFHASLGLNCMGWILLAW